MYRVTKSLLAANLRLLLAGVAGFAALWALVLSQRPGDETSAGVVAWWVGLCAVSLFNLCAWRVAAAAVTRRKGLTEPGVYLFQKRQLLLSAVYVIGCAFRSILPRADVQRI